jgi:5-methylcytosine-specific restriction endonuclease McrA
VTQSVSRYLFRRTRSASNTTRVFVLEDWENKVTTIAARVLVLNASYEPLSQTCVGRAVALVQSGAAVIHESVEGAFLRSAHTIMEHPLVIRLVKFIHVRGAYKPAIWSRKGVLARDKWECVYCGETATTVEHVIPLSRGGDSSWENTAGACYPCNHRKRDRLPDEAGLTLRFTPWHPVNLHALTDVASEFESFVQPEEPQKDSNPRSKTLRVT